MNMNQQMKLMKMAPTVAIVAIVLSITWLIIGWALPYSGVLMTVSMWFAAIVLIFVLILIAFVVYKMRKMKKDMEAMLGGDSDLMGLLNSPMGQQIMQMAEAMQSGSGNTGAELPTEAELNQMMQVFGGGNIAPATESVPLEIEGESVTKEDPPAEPTNLP